MIKRHISSDVIDSLKHFPVVLITGARQVGKSTLAQELSAEGWSGDYLTLDNRTVLDAEVTPRRCSRNGRNAPSPTGGKRLRVAL